MAFQIKIAFHPPGTTVYMYGQCDEITLSPGIAPNTVQLTVPKAEAAKLGGDWDQTGDICIYAGGGVEASPDVRLSGWSIMFVEDGLIGQAPGDAQPSVQEKLVTFADRRWEFTGGRGGFVTRPMRNVMTPDGLDATNPRSAYQMGYDLVSKMQFPSGMPAYTTAAYNSQAEVEPLLNAMPFNVQWDDVHCPTALVELLQQYGFVFVLTTAGIYKVYKQGTASYAALGSTPATFVPGVQTSAMELPSESAYHRSIAPKICVVTSGSNRAVMQMTMGLVFPGNEATTDGFQYCSFNLDGSLDNVQDLDWLAEYTPLSLITNVMPTGFVPDDAGYRNLFCMLWMVGPNRAKYLPMLNTTTAAMTDGTNDPRAIPVRIAARLPVYNDADGLWHQGTDLVEVTGFSLWKKDGIITVPFRLGRIDSGTGGVDNPYFAHFRTLTAGLDPDEGVGDLKITFSYHAAAGDYTDFYAQAYILDGSGNAVTYDTPTAMQSAATDDVQIIKCPQLVEYRNADGSSINGSCLAVEAQRIAQGVLGVATAVKVRKFAGLYQWDCDGQISSVTWDLKNALTKVEWQAHFAPAGAMLTKDQVKNTMEVFRRRMAGVDATPEKVARGAADSAPAPDHLPGIPQRLFPPAVTYWYRVLTTQVDVSNAGGPTTPADFTYSVTLPDGATAPPGYTLSTPLHVGQAKHNGLWIPAADNAVGLGYVDGDGNFVLWEADETESASVD